jgi:hypothetical protein
MGDALDCTTVAVWPAIVSVPVRAPELLVATANVTVPLPVPLAPPVMTIHVALLDADHAQPAVVVTLTEPTPPDRSIRCDEGAMEYEHESAGAAWFTVKVCPATVSVPVRALPVLAATLNPTEPPPLPLAPEVIESHEALLLAVHAHPAVVVTATLPLDALSETFWLVGEMEYEHEAGGAAWFTVKACPAIESVPLRALPVLAATLKPTEPLPLPLAPEVIVSHDALLLAFHAHPAVVVTATLPLDALSGTFWLVGAIE